jgi:hypothetical protein
MSTYDDASLVLVPSGYKNGVVFSQKPMDANGQLTFTRASSATRVGPNGYIEKVRTNYCRYSQDFASWSLLGAATRTTGVTDPNGGTTAVTISNIPSGNTTDGIILTNNPMTIGSETIIGSVWLKGSGTIAIALERGISGDYFFYISDITLTSTWTRYGIGGANAGARDGFTFYVCNRTGTTATSVDVAFAQVEYGDVATDYIPTTTAAVSVGPVSGTPRLDYLGSDCPRLLLEPQRSNILNFSESFNNVYFELGAAASISANTNETTDPSGYYGADKLTANGSGSIFVRRNVFGGTAQPCSVSLFVKKANHRYVGFRNSGTTSQHDVFDFDTKTWTNNTGATLSYEEHANGWFRLKSTNTDAVNLNYYWSVIPAVNTSGEENTTASNLSVYIWGGQAEQNVSYVSSYIPTLGTAVTRVEDTASKTGISSLIGQTEGVLFVDVDQFGGEGNSPYLLAWDGTFNNRIQISSGGTGTENQFTFYISVGGVNVVFYIHPTALTGRHKLALAYKLNDVVGYLDGVQVLNDTSATIPATSALQMAVASTNPVNAGINQALLFKTRLTNAQLAELTTL